MDNLSAWVLRILLSAASLPLRLPRCYATSTGDASISCRSYFMTLDIIKAVILGIVEGLTEFVPVSSTGHLLLVQRFFGFADEEFGKTFAVLIQFGAILALLSIYFVRLWQLLIGFFTDQVSRRFVLGILLSFLPAAIVGALAHDFIKSVLFNDWLICFTLIAGGAVLLWIDMMDLKPRYTDVTTYSRSEERRVGKEC